MLSQVYGKADTRKSQGSQEGRTLLVRDQAHGPPLVATDFPEQHLDLRGQRFRGFRCSENML